MTRLFIGSMAVVLFLMALLAADWLVTQLSGYAQMLP